ncbi:binding-protein-dependent transport systems inner membrane component [Catenulispora acidiphila DSM 44928]|uniref:Binding-protein-dependent transport systems inner membrane component n=1 Tax=Catenulispora acidiphila (strain DSM 44928 / JCM 14897 / NBRC 102108 / NRRL B-24433 / ID139908) TaxID=479433 RepID=C7QCT0_CATAD|nr:carbohydrate ABC transporter permease [Catenulispora acidiphila]ACU76543.1 binding-protein-dependent transport systems inner membrane component [Catenulispora acidiphila DSM 44928]
MSAAYRRAPRRAMTAFWNSVAMLVAIVLGFPIYWMLLTTVKSNKDLISQHPTFWPSHFDFSSFSSAMDDNFGANLWNTVVITLGSVFISLAVGLLAALAVARFDFRGRKPFIVAILVVQMVPLLTILVGLLPLLNSTNLYGSVLGVILAYLVFTIPFIIWTLRTYIVGIPVELDEAAMVDGCTKAQAFRRVVLPLLAPGLVSTGVFAWIQAWNEFVMAREILAPAQNKTAMVWLTFFSDTPTHGSDYSGQMAGALIIAAPVIILFTVFQSRLSTGLTAGAVKG